mgnify:CR=1 FL=1
MVVLLAPSASASVLFQMTSVPELLVTDTGNHTVRMWEPENGLSTVVGKAGAGASIGPGPGVPISAATLTDPEALTVGLTGLYISVEYSVMHVPWEALGLGVAP